MKICPNCGYDNKDTQLFCEECQLSFYRGKNIKNEFKFGQSWGLKLHNEGISSSHDKTRFEFISPLGGIVGWIVGVCIFWLLLAVFPSFFSYSFHSHWAPYLSWKVVEWFVWTSLIFGGISGVLAGKFRWWLASQEVPFYISPSGSGYLIAPFVWGILGGILMVAIYILFLGELLA